MCNLGERLSARPQILVVCTGNICRSPIGEVVLGAEIAQAQLDITVTSAGISSEEEGNPIFPPAAKVLRSHGYAVPKRHARKVRANDLEAAGLILGMTVGHARELRRLCDTAGVDRGKIHLWREFDNSGLQPAPQGCFGVGGCLETEQVKMLAARADSFYVSNGEWDVPDPWGSDDSAYEETLELVERGAQGIVTYLRNVAE